MREVGREDAGVLGLILLEDVGLHRAADARERLRLDPLVGLAVDHLVAGDAEQPEAEPVVAFGQRLAIAGPRAVGEHRLDPPLGRVPLPDRAQVLLDLLIDRGVHEEREDDRRRAVDRHRDRGRRRAEIESRVEPLRVVDGGDRDARVADLAVDVGPRMGILAVQRDRVERGREAHGGLAGREVVEAAVRLLGRALAREHPDRVLARAAIRVDAGRVRVRARQVLGLEEAQLVAPAGEARRRDLGDAQPAQRVAVVVAGDRPAAHVVGVRLRGDPLDPRRELPERLDGLGCRAPRARRCRRPGTARARRARAPRPDRARRARAAADRRPP